MVPSSASTACAMVQGHERKGGFNRYFSIKMMGLIGRLYSLTALTTPIYTCAMVQGTKSAFSVISCRGVKRVYCVLVLVVLEVEVYIVVVLVVVVVVVVFTW
jgi:hypothetical protein